MSLLSIKITKQISRNEFRRSILSNSNMMYQAHDLPSYVKLLITQANRMSNIRLSIYQRVFHIFYNYVRSQDTDLVSNVNEIRSVCGNE